MTEAEYLVATPAERKILLDKAVKAATEEYLACLFLHNSDEKRYGHIAERLETDYVLTGEGIKRS